MKYRPLVSFSGTFGAYAPGDIIDEDTLSAEAKAADVIADWTRAGFIEPVKATTEQATAPAAPEQAVAPAASEERPEPPAVAPVAQPPAKPANKSKGK